MDIGSRHNFLPLKPLILSHTFIIPSFLNILCEIVGERLKLCEYAREFGHRVEKCGSRVRGVEAISTDKN
jgi:hypothetical protein